MYYEYIKCFKSMLQFVSTVAVESILIYFIPFNFFSQINRCLLQVMFKGNSVHTKPQLLIRAILISGVKFPPPTHKTHLFQSCCLDLIIIFKRWCYVPILHLFIDITWRKRKNSCFLRAFWHILTVCKLRYSKSRQCYINLGMWVVVVCWCCFLFFFFWLCDNDYDRNWRNNWGKKRR